MHVKLEVETQPLSNFVTKLQHAFRKALWLSVIVCMNVAGLIFCFTWIPNHVRKPNDALIMSWVLAISWTIGLWGGIWSRREQMRQEARWRNAID